MAPMLTQRAFLAMTLGAALALTPAAASFAAPTAGETSPGDVHHITDDGNPWDDWFDWWPWPNKPTPTPTPTPTPSVTGEPAPVTPTVGPTSAPAPGGPFEQPAPVRGDHIDGNRTRAAYDYANAIRESVTIDASFDSDNDGRNDKIVMDIIRPREMADKGIDAPVVMVASPYFTSLGRGAKGEKKSYDRDGNLELFPLWLDNYFVERGYAVVAVDTIGTGRSNGCSDIGGPNDIASVTDAIRWLNGKGSATYLAGGRGTARADWSTGSVGMIGKSYDGTVANGAAATGVDGLKTIVPVNAISSWYDYTRINGINYRPRYMSTLGQAVANNPRKCAGLHDRITRDTDAGLGMNNAWRERDYVKDARNVKSSVLLVHGQHDFNVFMENAGNWHTELTKHGVPMSVYLTQAEHKDPFDINRREWVDYLHEWFDYWLSGLSTGTMSGPLSRVEHNLNTFTKDATWPVGDKVNIPLSQGIVGGGSTARLEPNRSRTSRLIDNPSQTRDDRVMYVSGRLDRDVRLSGESSITMRIKTNASTLPLAVKVVDYGRAERYDSTRKSGGESCWGGETRTDNPCYPNQHNTGRVTDSGVIASGWLNTSFRDGIDREQSIPRGRWFDVTVPIMASDNIVKSGHTFGVMITTTDVDLRGNVRADDGVEIDLDSITFNANMIGADQLTRAGVAGTAPEGTIEAVDTEVAMTDLRNVN